MKTVNVKKNNTLYTSKDKQRKHIELNDSFSKFENEFESDCNRLIFSPSFRRLQGKIQLFPIGESDFFRNRLTHSIEVSSVALTITNKLNKDLESDKGARFIDKDVVRFACLAHDLGHPPFGHKGERVLNECMFVCGGFESNAQTLRILTRVEKGLISHKNLRKSQYRNGLNITYRCLASLIKHYQTIIPQKDDKNNIVLAKGFYKSEEDLVNEILSNVNNINAGLPVKTIECQIMDLADDITNALHDLEDSIKGRFFNLFDLFVPNDDVLEFIKLKANSNSILEKTNKDIFIELNDIFQRANVFDIDERQDETDWKQIVSSVYKKMQQLTENGYERKKFIRGLLNKYIESAEINYNYDNPSISLLQVNEKIKFQIMILKEFHRLFQQKSVNTEISDFRGGQIVKSIFSTLVQNPELMPKDFFNWYKLEVSNSIKCVENHIIDQSKRVICDFISGMTDNYCVEFYGRLFSETPQSYYKQI